MAPARATAKASSPASFFIFLPFPPNELLRRGGARGSPHSFKPSQSVEWNARRSSRLRVGGEAAEPFGDEREAHHEVEDHHHLGVAEIVVHQAPGHKAYEPAQRAERQPALDPVKGRAAPER